MNKDEVYEVELSKEEMMYLLDLLQLVGGQLGDADPLGKEVNEIYRCMRKDTQEIKSDEYVGKYVTGTVKRTG